jgi:hypothetical protein
MVTEGMEDLLHLLQMLGARPAKQQNVIEENENKLPNKRAQHIIHNDLESRGCVDQPKGHHQELKVSTMCAKSSCRCRLDACTLGDSHCRGQAW